MHHLASTMCFEFQIWKLRPFLSTNDWYSNESIQIRKYRYRRKWHDGNDLIIFSGVYCCRNYQFSAIITIFYIIFEDVWRMFRVACHQLWALRKDVCHVTVKQSCQALMWNWQNRKWIFYGTESSVLMKLVGWCLWRYFNKLYYRRLNYNFKKDNPAVQVNIILWTLPIPLCSCSYVAILWYSRNVVT